MRIFAAAVFRGFNNDGMWVVKTAAFALCVCACVFHKEEKNGFYDNL